MRVFPIYCSEDQYVTFRVAASLRESGYSVWLDFPAYAPGKGVEEQICHYMLASQLIIAIWTPAAEENLHFRADWATARTLNKRIILVSVEGARPDEIPPFCEIVLASTVDDVAGSLSSHLNSNRGHSIFISYANEDAQTAQRLLALINQSRHSVWLDRFSLDPGSDFPSEILRGIEECNYLFLIWSRHARRSGWVEREWAYAHQNSKAIIPVLLDATPLPGAIEHINGIRGVDDKAIRSYLGIAARPAPGRRGVIARAVDQIRSHLHLVTVRRHNR